MPEPERIRSVLAFLVVGGFLAVMGCWFVFPLKGDAQLFNVMLGTLGSGGFMVVVAYYFGSSAGSKNKDDTIATLTGAQKNRGSNPPAAGAPRSTVSVQP